MMKKKLLYLLEYKSCNSYTNVRPKNKINHELNHKIQNPTKKVGFCIFMFISKIIPTQ